MRNRVLVYKNRSKINKSLLNDLDIEYMKVLSNADDYAHLQSLLFLKAMTVGTFKDNLTSVYGVDPLSREFESNLVGNIFNDIPQRGRRR